MHQKKSEAQIGTESSGVSSDFNPTPPQIPPSTLTQKHPNLSHNFYLGPYPYLHSPASSSSSSSSTNPPNQTLQIVIGDDRSNAGSTNFGSKGKNYVNGRGELQSDSYASKPPTTFKRPQFFTNSPTLSNALNRYKVSPSKLNLLYIRSQKVLTNFHRHFRYLRRRVRIHLRLILLLSLPVFYFWVSHPSSSLALDLLSAFAFSAALLFSLNLAIPRLPTIRLFLARSLPIKIGARDHLGVRNSLPVFWSIGSRQKADKKAITGCYVQAYGNGDVYEGEFHKGKCSGSGVYYYYMSGRYEGDWIDGKYDGHGVETWARGSRYRGQYRQGLRHGFGVYRFYTGDVYAGEWSNGQSHGCGVHTCEDGSKYVGEFKWGVKHGLGHYHFRNGDRYAGEYFADKMHGFGVYWFANGHRYEGAWHEGRRQGLGMYAFRNGEAQSGHWQNGILDVPSTQTAVFPVSPVAVNHSKVLNVVQEARCAAEKAYEVAKVDERVNRAVAAANRAANAARVASVKAVQKQMHGRSNSDDIPLSVM